MKRSPQDITDALGCSQGILSIARLPKTDQRCAFQAAVISRFLGFLSALIVLGALVPADGQPVSGLSRRWEHVYNRETPTGGNLGYSSLVRADSAGNTVTIVMSSNLRDGMDMIVTKRQKTTGRVLWEKRLSSPGSKDDYALDAAFDAQGDLYVTGSWNSFYHQGSRTFEMDLVTFRLSGVTGELLWLKTVNHSPTGEELGRKIRILPSGMVDVWGHYSPNSQTPAGSTMIYLRYSPQGELLREVQRPLGSLGQSEFTGENHVVINDSGRIQKINLSSGGLDWEKQAANTMLLAHEQVGVVCAVNESNEFYNPRWRLTCLSYLDGSVVWSRQLVQGAMLLGSFRDSGNGLIIAAGMTQLYDESSWIERLNTQDGTAVWTHQLSNMINIFLKPSGDGGSIVGGLIDVRGNGQAYFVKLSQSGHRVFSAQVSMPAGCFGPLLDVCTDARGEVTVTGYYQASDQVVPVPPDAYFAAGYSSRGAVLWRNNWAGGPSMSRELGYRARFDSLGNVVAMALSNPLLYVTSQDIIIKKLEARSGRLLWLKKYDGPGMREDWCGGIAVDDGDDVLACVTSYTSTLVSDANTDVIVLKYKGDDGGLLWSRRLMLPHGHSPVMRVTSEGDVIVAARAQATNPLSIRTELIRISGANGSIRWRHQLGTLEVSDMLVTASGRIMLTYTGVVGGRSVARLASFLVQDGTSMWNTIVSHHQAITASAGLLAVGGGQKVICMNYQNMTAATTDVALSSFDPTSQQPEWQIHHRPHDPAGSFGQVSLSTSSDGRIFIGGRENLSPGLSHLFLASYDDMDGAERWVVPRLEGFQNGHLWSIHSNNRLGLVLSLSNGLRSSVNGLSPENGSLAWSLPSGSPEGDDSMSFEITELNSEGNMAVTDSRSSDFKVTLFTPQNPAFPVLTQPACVEVTTEQGKDFGGVFVGESRALLFRLKNAGDADLTLLGSVPGEVRLEGSGAFRVTAQPNSPVLPSGAETDFAVAFEPEAEGLAEAQLILEMGGASGNTWIFPLKGRGFAKNSLAFARPVWQAGSRDRNVDVTVRREESGEAAAVSIVARTRQASVLPSFSTALPGQHFTAPSPEQGRLSFAAGETEKTLRIALPAPPAGVQPARHFELALEDAENAPLGVAATAVVELLPSDAARTVIQVLSPAAKVSARLPMLVEGMIQDAGGLRSVEVRLNDACPLVPQLRDGSRSGSWAFSAPLTPRDGQNTLEVSAVDLHGNATTQRRVFTFTPMYALPVAVSSTTGGTVSITRRAGAALRLVSDGADVAAGTEVELRAAARPGHWFSHWIGLPAAADEMHDRVRFRTRHRDLSGITAVFVPSPLVGRGASVDFRGLLQPTSIGPREARYMGSFAARVVASTGAMTGHVELAGQRFAFAGSLRADGSLWFNQAGVHSRFVNLGKLSLTGRWQPLQMDLTGVVEPAVSMEGFAFAPKYHAQNPAPEHLLGSRGKPGRLNAVFAITQPGSVSSYPAGYSQASFTVSRLGQVTASGVLADQTAFSWAGPITDAGRLDLCSFFRMPQAAANDNRGCFIGSVTIDDSGLMGGQMSWFRPPLLRLNQSARLMYEAGWPQGMVLDISGASYLPATNFQNALSFADNIPSFIRFTQGGLLEPVSFMTLFNGNRILLYNGSPNQLSLVLNPSTGVISGSMAADSARPARRASFRGVIMGYGAQGFFINPHGLETRPESGVFEINQ